MNSLIKFAIVPLAIVLNGCVIGSAGFPVASQIEVLTLMNTEKTISDNIVSYVSGKDCSSVRRERGLSYCKEDALQPPKTKRYCYKELSKVTCYKTEDPLGRYTKVDSNDHNVPR
ncbi:MAG: hypothetical protein CFH06_01114 [Alphaproteobacteria bacterium MarineAlpha3_Bin5]|nr:hypothetical protein [Magnetovibrio sp.]PPR77769.1 MAG: hypothetical protein CFH06_01114 [Alphaproteobacteria bacterium MarineAlpha3_Bin5]